MMTAMMITMIMMIEAANMYTSIHKYTYSVWILGLFCFCVFDCDDDVGFASIHTLCEFFRSFCCQNRWQGRITSPLLDHHHHGDGNIVHDDDVHNSIGNDDGFVIPTKVTMVVLMMISATMVMMMMLKMKNYHWKASGDGGDTFYNNDDDNLKRSDKDKNWMTLVGPQCVISSTFTWNSWWWWCWILSFLMIF